jgi:hypothetical protein
VPVNTDGVVADCDADCDALCAQLAGAHMAAAAKASAQHRRTPLISGIRRIIMVSEKPFRRSKIVHPDIYKGFGGISKSRASPFLRCPKEDARHRN